MRQLEFGKPFVKAVIFREFGMERCTEAGPLANGDDLVAIAGKHLDSLSNPGDDGRADEYARDAFGKAHKINVILKTMNLRTERVAPDRDVQEIEGELLSVLHFRRQHDHPHAGAPKGHAGLSALNQGGAKSKPLHQLSYGGTFAPGNDDSIDASKVVGSTNFVA